MSTAIFIRRKHIVSLIVGVMLCSCRLLPNMYAPNELNMPLPANKGELKADLNYGGLGNYSGSVSYALGRHLLVYGNVFDCNTPSFGGLPAFYQFGYEEGLGYYHRFGGHGVVEVLGGIGQANIRSEAHNTFINFFGPAPDSIETLKINAVLKMASLQADVGYIANGFEFGLGLRLRDFATNATYIASYTDTSGMFLRAKNIPVNGHFLMLEPGIMIAGGFSPVKLKVAFGVSFQVGGLQLSSEYGPNYIPYYGTVGLNIDLFGKDKKTD